MSEEVEKPKRDEHGRLLPGQALRKTSYKINARKISKRLRAEMVRRYANEPVGPDGEVLGPERAQLKHYFVLMSIMEKDTEKASDRIKAVAELANRLDGKPVETVELDAKVENHTPLEDAMRGMTPEQLLELVRTIRDRK